MHLRTTPKAPPTAADFMVYASSTEAVGEVVRRATSQPANQEVAFSDDFLQPGELPLTATVFNESVTRMVVPPLLDVWDELEAAVEPLLHELFYAGPTIDLPLIGDQIDAVSQPILNPETASPTVDARVRRSRQAP